MRTHERREVGRAAPTRFVSERRRASARSLLHLACAACLVLVGACSDTVPQRSPSAKLASRTSSPSLSVNEDGGPSRAACTGGGSAGACESTAVCGDGVRSNAEQCDDGNRASGDGCDAKCLLEVSSTCGNGEIDPGEECDDGNRSDMDACSNTCLKNVCGNDRIDVTEECDDGSGDHADAGIGCTRDCREVRCRNGRVEPGEECDDGDDRDDNGCTNQCKIMICGNGKIEVKEECDDGNAADGDACSSRCKKIVCGNKRIDPGEECDGDTRCDETCHKKQTTPCQLCQQKYCKAGFPDPAFKAPWYDGCFNGNFPRALPDDKMPPDGAVTMDYDRPTFAKLCMGVLDCALQHQCWSDEFQMAKCYCGSSPVDTCFSTVGPKDPPCEAEIVAAANVEASDRQNVSIRMDDPSFPLGYARYLVDCSRTRCASECMPSLPSLCGNGVVENSESCDDGNLVDGDACTRCGAVP